jgi:hypothetical protein
VYHFAKGGDLETFGERKMRELEKKILGAGKRRSLQRWVAAPLKVKVRIVKQPIYNKRTIERAVAVDGPLCAEKSPDAGIPREESFLFPFNGLKGATTYSPFYRFIQCYP